MPCNYPRCQAYSSCLQLGIGSEWMGSRQVCMRKHCDILAGKCEDHARSFQNFHPGVEYKTCILIRIQEQTEHNTCTTYLPWSTGDTNEISLSFQVLESSSSLSGSSNCCIRSAQAVSNIVDACVIKKKRWL